MSIAQFDVIKASGELPSAKGVALAIIRLAQRDDISIGELARIVKTDPAFVGRLLKAANSVGKGTGKTVSTVQDAITVVGLPSVRNLALGFSLLTSHRSGFCTQFDYDRFWTGAALFAVAMQSVSLSCGSLAHEDAFVLGLLARVGELGLATAFPDAYSQVLETAAGNRAELRYLEARQIGMSHTELSCAMLEDFGLAKVYADGVRFYEAPAQSGYAEGSRPFMVMYSLALARAITELCQASEAEQPELMSEVLRNAVRLGLDESSVIGLLDQLAHDWVDWSHLLPLTPIALPPFSALLARTREGSVSAVTLTANRNAMRILVVDDDASMRVMLKAMLERAGHVVKVAEDGRQGLEMATEFQPQLMVVDWLMPEMSGIELASALRQTRVGRSIYIVILTSLEEEDRLIEAFEHGVDDFINKPLKPRVLAARIRAGQRVVSLQEEIEADREEIRRFAAELATTNRRLQEVALTDALTGFPNRRYAMERIAQEWASAIRSGQDLACMMVDVDEFKKINDVYGHDIGDQALRLTAQALKQGLRAHDVVCRTGGDEFLIICPNTTLDQALACAERVRRAVDGLEINLPNAVVDLTISLGVSVRDEAMADFEALIRRADQALLQSKQRGRNRVSQFAIA